MEIQAASGEWMNEFVRRPSRRRDNRVYLPAADIIKRTIRRSWTISNPTPRWSALRSSQEFRPYNSLPRDQDINNYPSLALHQTNLRNQQNLSVDLSSSPYRRRSPTRKTQSEDVYNERIDPPINLSMSSNSSGETQISERPVRLNPLMKLAETRPRERKVSPRRNKKSTSSGESNEAVNVADNKSQGFRSPDLPTKFDKPNVEKRISFDSKINSKLTTNVLRTQSLTDERIRDRRQIGTRTLQELADEGHAASEGNIAKDDPAPVELCDIEPLSGTVFRKMTVRRRRQDMRKLPAVDTGLDFLIPDGDDYKLVFISSDSSSKEEDIDDNDSSSTASSFPIDECDWDYFEPGSGTGTRTATAVLSWNSPFSSPRVYRRNVVDSPLGSPIVYRRRRTRESDTGTDEDNTRFDSGSPASSDSLFQTRMSSEEPLEPIRAEIFTEDAAALKCKHTDETEPKNPCQNCGGGVSNPQYIPIPVPVPIPFPVPAALWTNQEAFSIFGSQSNMSNLDPNIASRLRVIPRNLWPYYTQAALIWPLINNRSSDGVGAPATGEFGALNSVLQGDHNTTVGTTTMPTAATDRDISQRTTACSSKTNTETNGDAHKDDQHDLSAVNNIKTVEESREIAGYLECENRYVSSSDSSRDSSDSDDTSGNENRKPRTRRIYNVNSGDSNRQSDDALPSSNVTSDCDEDGRNSHSSVREDDMSSSGSADTDSDDTGTVADRKPKKFSRIFVVNKNISSSSDASSGRSDTDSSDNDTDTEMDCTVILTNIKPIDDNFPSEISLDKPNGNADTEIIEDKDIKEFPNCDMQNGDNIKEVKFLDDLHFKTDIHTKQMKERESMSSSPGLSDVSAESLNSSDVEQVREYTLEDPNNDSNEKYSDKSENEMVICEYRIDKDDDYQSSDINTNENVECNIEKDDTTEISVEVSVPEKNDEKVETDLSNFDGEPISTFVKIGDKTEEISESSMIFESETGNDDNSNCLRFVEWNNKIRSKGNAKVGDTTVNTRDQAGGPTTLVSSEYSARNAARYTSLVMITQEPAPSYQQVNVVTSDTTTLVPDNNDVIVQHTNWQDSDRKKNNVEEKLNDHENQFKETVTVITGGETLSAFEEGLADDDSWVENLSYEDEDDDEDDDSSSGDEVTLTCSAAIDQEDELRGYNRAAIDFTLHTILEESCEESEVEQNVTTKRKDRPASATDLEKYFFFGLGDGTVPSINSNREDAISETSSIYSEGMESLGGPEDNQQQNDNSDTAELASSRLEKYFLSGFMGFTAERRDSDGSVGSDSEGRPSPEQRRKKLVRARGTGRSHSSSLDNLDKAENDPASETQVNSEDSSSSDSDTYDEINSFEKPDGQFDTVKRKKGKKKTIATSAENLETTHEVDEKDKDSDDDEDGHKTPQPEILPASNLTTTKDQQSRDSGFIGSCDDLLREQRENSTPELPSNKSENHTTLENVPEEKKLEEKFSNPPPATSLTRKDSFNNWSSDEETNLMMCKMRQFFKTMIANSQCPSSKPGTPNLNARMSPKPLPSPRIKSRCKPPQLVYFENELTRLMKTVPGIRDDQVREIVEYLSSEDTWSDSYDSSDYTSSDLEGAATKTALQQQISDSCKQIINKFDNTVDDEGDEGDGGIVDESHGLNKETAFVYQKLVASLEKMATGETTNIPKLTPHNSPPLIAKVMHHIGSRLVALMHEVSSGESHASNSPKTKHYHRRLQHKMSSASSTTTEDDGPDIGNDNDRMDNFEEAPYNLLPRSRSHDLLVGESRNLTQFSNGVSDPVEEREASDCERFSWRGSFESALLATDSRNRLSLLGSEGSASASALAIAAKRRSAGDLLFSHKSLSREQLDRVRSCGSIGGANSEDKLWVATATRPNRRRSSVPDASYGSGGSADGEDEDDEIESRSTLPRSLQSGTQSTNSLPRLPTNASSNTMQKSQSMYHFLPQNVKSARYRPPGINRLTSAPKRAVSAPGLQPSHQRRGRRSQQQNVPSDDVSEAHSSPMLASKNNSKSASPSPVAPVVRHNAGSISSQEWNNEDDIDRLVGLQGRSSLSSLGVRSDSMASVYSGAGEGRYGTVTVRGQVEFGLQYNYKAGALEILIKQCRDLAPVDAKRNRSDPYVKVYLLPDKSKSGKRKTKVKKHTLNPVFDECLKFHISLNDLETRTLWLTVWHSDMFGRNDFLGEVMMTLENKVFDDPTPKLYNLQERTEPFEELPAYKGDIIVCLKFVPPDMTLQKKGKRSRGALHVLVKEAKSLTAVKANGTSDPFCKSYLLPDKGRSSKQKTPVAKRTINPIWNYTFEYDNVTLQDLAERSLELTVWDHDRLASNEFLGGVRFSLGTGKYYGKAVEWMDASGKELNLWKSMLERPNFWVEGCVSLRPTLDTKLL